MKLRIFCLMLALLLTGCAGAPAPQPEATTTAAQSSVSADTYTFVESVMGGAFQVTWTLELRDDGTYCLTEENPMAGAIAHEGTYTVENDIVITGPFEGEAPKAQFFESDKSCFWRLEGETCVPVNYSEGTPEGHPARRPEGPDTKSEAEPLPGGILDLAYGQNSGSQVMNLYLPENTKNAPVIVLVHGGGFLFGDAAMPALQTITKAALEKGYAVASVDYRKSSESPFPAALADVKAAVRFLRANAAQYGLDTENIAIWGESAGAYLALMTALTPQVEALNADVTDHLQESSAVKAFVSFYAPVEFYTMYEEQGNPQAAADSFESKFLGQDILKDKDATYATYWETYQDQIPEDLQAWIQAGDSDSKVPCTQSENLAQRLTEYLGEDQIVFQLLAGADHEDPAFYTEENISAVLTWLDGILKG